MREARAKRGRVQSHRALPGREAGDKSEHVQPARDQRLGSDRTRVERSHRSQARLADARSHSRDGTRSRGGAHPGTSLGDNHRIGSFPASVVGGHSSRGVTARIQYSCEFADLGQTRVRPVESGESMIPSSRGRNRRSRDGGQSLDSALCGLEVGLLRLTPAL